VDCFGGVWKPHKGYWGNISAKVIPRPDSDGGRDACIQV
jgi:hypothetical protein